MALVRALKREKLLPAVFPEEDAEVSSAFIEAVYRYLARTPARLLMIHLEDALGEVNQVNMPGTTDQHPNWRRKIGLDIERLGQDTRVLGLAEALREERPTLRRRARRRGRP